MISQDVIFEMVYLGIAFFVALVLSLLFAWLSKRVAVYTGVMDHPDPRKIHKTPIPCLGGLAIGLAMGIALVLSWANPVQPMKAFLLGGAIITLAGLLDDKFRLSPAQKLVGQILAVSAFIAAGGGTLDSLGDFLGVGEIRTGSLAPVVTMFCMIGVINAMNLSDGLDGLAGGMGVIAALFYTVLAYQHQAWHWVVVSLIFIGVLIGFLRFNQYSAMLFMGDSGSQLTGFSLAAIAVGLAQGHGPAGAISPVTLAVVLGIPIIDTLWVMGRRLFLARRLFKPDRSHLHHRLLALGIGHSEVVTLIYGMMLFFGFLAWYGSQWPEFIQFYISLSLLAVIYVGLFWVENREGRRQKGKSVLFKPVSKITIRSNLLSFLIKYLPFVLILCFILPSFFIFPIPWLYGLLSISAALFLMLLYPWRTGKKSLVVAHGVMYSACFFLLVIYLFAPHKPLWVLPMLYAVSALALLWVVVKTLSSRWDPRLYPNGFEVLIISFSWVIPFVVLPMLGIEGDVRRAIIVACVLSLPLLYLLKLTVRRHRPSNNWVAVCFLAVFVSLSLAAFFGWGTGKGQRTAFRASHVNGWNHPAPPITPYSVTCTPPRTGPKRPVFPWKPRSVQ